MPYGPPESQSRNAQYVVNAHYKNTEILVVGRLDQGSGTPPEEVKDEAWQSLVDLISASPDWTLEGAGKAYDTRQDVTPTEQP